MANVFSRQNKMDIASSLYAEVGKSKAHPVSISQLTFVFFFPRVLFNDSLFLTAFNMMATISVFQNQHVHIQTFPQVKPEQIHSGKGIEVVVFIGKPH